MQYKVLGKKDAKIITAMAGGIIPRGGASFELGAADLADKWLPRTDYMLSKMPVPTRMVLLITIRLLNYVWPVLHMKKFRQLAGMEEMERTELFHLIENSPFPAPVSIIIVKLLVFPAFYGLPEVKDAIGYREKIDHGAQFEGLKD